MFFLAIWLVLFLIMMVLPMCRCWENDRRNEKHSGLKDAIAFVLFMFCILLMGFVAVNNKYIQDLVTIPYKKGE